MDKQKVLDHFSGNYLAFYLRYFPELKPKGRQAQTLCPFHDDKKPSLSINIETGLFKCFACDAQGDIFSFHQRHHGMNSDFSKVVNGIAADFGITVKPKPAKGRITATYDYLDETGKIIFQTCRFQPKNFKQRRPNGKGGYLWNLKGIEPVLYRLPEVLKADEVLIVEGEKDADNLTKLGFTATTCPMGAGKWRENYNGYLKGKNVAIIPDNDDPGREHARNIARQLQGVAQSIKIIELPELQDKGDVSDFLATLDDPDTAAERLSIVIEQGEPFSEPIEPGSEKPTSKPRQGPSCITMSALCAKEFQPIEWLLPDIFPIGSILLAGPPKLGKSVFVLNLAVAVATDGDVYGGYTCGTGDVVYLALEDNERRLQTRIKANLNGRSPSDRMHLFHLGSNWPCLGEGCINELRRKIDACINPKLVIVDTLARVRPAKERRKAQYDLDYADLSRFHVLTSEYPGLTIIIISHTRKAAADDVFDTISGTQGLSGAVDTLAVMAGFRGKGEAKLVVAGRDVMDVNKALTYEKALWSWKIAGDAVEIAISENQEAMFQALKKFDSEDGLTPTEIRELSGGRINRETIKYNLREWLSTGVVERLKRGKYRLGSGARKAGSLESILLSSINIPEYIFK